MYGDPIPVMGDRITGYVLPDVTRQEWKVTTLAFLAVTSFALLGAFFLHQYCGDLPALMLLVPTTSLPFLSSAFYISTKAARYESFPRGGNPLLLEEPEEPHYPGSHVDTRLPIGDQEGPLPVEVRDPASPVDAASAKPAPAECYHREGDLLPADPKDLQHLVPGAAAQASMSGQEDLLEDEAHRSSAIHLTHVGSLDPLLLPEDEKERLKDIDRTNFKLKSGNDASGEVILQRLPAGSSESILLPGRTREEQAASLRASLEDLCPEAADPALAATELYQVAWQNTSSILTFLVNGNWVGYDQGLLVPAMTPDNGGWTFESNATKSHGIARLEVDYVLAKWADPASPWRIVKAELIIDLEARTLEAHLHAPRLSG